MVTKLVNVRLPEQLYKEGKEIVEQGSYANFQELMKDAIRHTIKDINVDKTLINLEKSFGSTRNKKKKAFTSEIKDQIAEKLAKNIDKQKELFKRAGL